MTQISATTFFELLGGKIEALQIEQDREFIGLSADALAGNITSIHARLRCIEGLRYAMGALQRARLEWAEQLGLVDSSK